MGYYTDYKLKSESGLEKDENFRKYFDEVTSERIDSLNGTTWYDWKSDMEKISKKYPVEKFTLNGSGEESGDIWIAYFHDGKSQVCKTIITFEERTLW